MQHAGAAPRLYLGIDAGPIFDEDGKLIAVVETLRDLTEQKLAQMALESLAVKDSLTGLANRRCFDETLEAAWLHARREDQPISLLLIDVDHFKQFNDTYGHQPGDDCLRSVGQAIQQHAMRPLDLAARYGGEEFAVLLPSTWEDGTYCVAERIRVAVQELGIPHAGSTTDRFLSVSVGGSTMMPAQGGDFTDLVRLADEALYAAKHAGRNRIETRVQPHAAA